MDTIKATPRPWHYNHGKPQILAHFRHQADDGFWAEIAAVEKSVNIPNWEANLALIVEAVNNYDRLKRVEDIARSFVAYYQARSPLVLGNGKASKTYYELLREIGG